MPDADQQSSSASTWLQGGSSVIVGNQPFTMGRSMLVLPHTALANTREAAVSQPLGTFADPEAAGIEERLFGRGREF